MSLLRPRSALGVLQDHASPAPVMTPMVDVVMVILVFFMAGVSVMGPRWMLGSRLPTPAAESKPSSLLRVRIELVVSEQGRTRARASRVSPEPAAAEEIADLAALAAWLDSALPTAQRDVAVVLIAPGGDVPYQDVVLAHEICYRLGIGRVALAGAPTTP